MKHSIGALFVLSAAASLLTSCGPGTTGLPPGTGGSCGPPPVQLDVLYPIPNARRAPRNLRTIYIATNGHLPNAGAYQFYLTQSSGSSTATSTFFGTGKSQIPRPHARPSFANPIYYATSVPSGYRIGRRQSVSLRWNIPRSGCTPRWVVSSFRTR